MGAWFLSVGGLLFLLQVVAMVRVGQLRLNSSAGIMRDGLPPGTHSPVWTAADVEGVRRDFPARGRWQLLLFSDHSLKDFAETVDGLRALIEDPESPDLVLLTRRQPELTELIVSSLGLRIPIVPVMDYTYNHYNVRVMPFAVVVDDEGVVRLSRLVSTRGTLLATVQLAHAQPRALSNYVSPD